MREGLPAEPRKTPSEHARYDLGKVKAWLDARAQAPTLTLEERVARLEAQMLELRRTG